MVMYGIGLVFALLAVAVEAQTQVMAGVVLALAGGFAVLVLRGLGYDRLVMERLGLRRLFPRRRSAAAEAVTRASAGARQGAAKGGRVGSRTA
jgi:hypothetical protein